MLNCCSSMHVKSQSCIVLFDFLLQQLYGILGQPSYLHFSISVKLYPAYPCIRLVLLQVEVSAGQIGCEKD